MPSRIVVDVRAKEKYQSIALIAKVMAKSTAQPAAAMAFEIVAIAAEAVLSGATIAMVVVL